MIQSNVSTSTQHWNEPIWTRNTNKQLSNEFFESLCRKQLSDSSPLQWDTKTLQSFKVQWKLHRHRNPPAVEINPSFKAGWDVHKRIGELKHEKCFNSYARSLVTTLPTLRIPSHPIKLNLLLQPHEHWGGSGGKASFCEIISYKYKFSRTSWS